MTTTLTTPSRSARRWSSGRTSRTAIPPLRISVDRSESAAGPGCRPTSTSPSAPDGNAIASASDTTSGKTNVQNTASGSRMNSRKRASVSCTSGDETRSPIAQMPSCQSHEHVLERSVMGDHFRRAEPGDQFLRRADGDDAAVVDDGHAIAQKLRLLHVMCRHQNRAAARTELIEQPPQLTPRVRVEPGCRLVEKQQVRIRSEEHTSELQSLAYLVCRLLLEKKKKKKNNISN